jgi:streptomycin 3"-adenylyltransferase
MFRLLPNLKNYLKETNKRRHAFILKANHDRRDCMEYTFPRNTPKFTREVLRETLSDVHTILQGNLIGIYLYGSLAMECFQPTSSDIDVILVVKETLSKEQRKKIIEYLKGACSKDIPIELSIIRADAIQNPHYPMTVDLHYEYWGNVFENEKDKEILSNLYTTRKRGFCVWGKPINELFSRIPARYHVRSVIEDIEHTRRYLHEKPERVGYNVQVYWILGSCRILAFIREGKVLSKLEAGQWGLAYLPRKYHSLVELALSSYQGKKKDCVWNPNELDAFADYMTERIMRESKLTEHE